MKRLHAYTHLLCLTFVIGCFAALLLLFTGQAVRAGPSSAPAQIGVAAPPASNLGSQYIPGVKCTLSVTNEQDFTNQSVATAWANESAFPTLASYSGLVLSFGDVPNSPLQFDAFDEYFRLDNATVGATYKVEAIPDYTTNYNLGLIAYNLNKTPILSDTNPADNNTAAVTFIADGIGPYYVKVVQLTQYCTGLTYRLKVTYNPPTATPTPTGTSTPSPGDVEDDFEPNEDFNGAKPLNANSYTGLTLYNTSYAAPSDDKDWYTIFVGASQLGTEYTINFVSDGNLPIMDLDIYNPSKGLAAQKLGANNLTFDWTPTLAGAYYFYIRRSGGSPTTGNGTYKITWSSTGPTATPTEEGAGPTDTPVPGLDAFEPNYDFDHAAGIGLNVKYTSINFVPLPGQTINNDFFKIRVKRGMLVTCETLDLSAGTDTNMILYDDSRQGLAGNDDVDKLLGDLRSRVTVSINFDGFLYILVGQGYAVPPSQAIQYNYSLQCTSGAGQASATPPPSTPALVAPTTAPQPTAPPPPSATPVPPPPTALPPISVRPLATPTPAGPVQQIVTADLRVSYDVNENGAADPGEGVVGLPVRVYDNVSGALLAQGFTDDTGRAVLSVPSTGPILVVVPYLSFETVVQPDGATIPVLISPRDLPDQIP